MRLHEIESWALRIIEQVRLRQPIEDTRVELKAKWPDDPKKAARWIAGHANAARGEPILWLIGVDERKGEIPGVDFVDLASWYNAVKASFDELAPEPVSLNIPVEDVTIAALYFETERAPFVVKVAEGGTVQREVPWREATGIKSATRSQLLKLLSPLQKLPSIEVVSSLLKTGKPWVSAKSEEYLPWEVYTALFLTQPTEQETVIPSHRCSISFQIAGHKMFGPFSAGIEFRGAGWANVNATKTGASIKGSGLFELRYKVHLKRESNIESDFNYEAKLSLTLRPSNLDAVIPIAINMAPGSPTSEGTWRWEYGYHDFYS
jgi:hypothetical protein